jgi:hypothetical protein
VAGGLFSPVASTNKTEIFLKVALNTITLILKQYFIFMRGIQTHNFSGENTVLNKIEHTSLIQFNGFLLLFNNITEILLKVALNIITQTCFNATIKQYQCIYLYFVLIYIVWYI